MKVIELTKGQVAIVDDEDFTELAQYRWQCTVTGYARRRKPGVKPTWVFMHREIVKPPTGCEVDHKNQNKLDNRRSNLRVVTRQQNVWNRPVQPRNKTGAKGVYFSKKIQKYYSRIRENGGYRYLGVFETVKAAKSAYDTEAKRIHGEFACLN